MVVQMSNKEVTLLLQALKVYKASKGYSTGTHDMIQKVESWLCVNADPQVVKIAGRLDNVEDGIMDTLVDYDYAQVSIGDLMSKLEPLLLERNYLVKLLWGNGGLLVDKEEGVVL